MQVSEDRHPTRARADDLVRRLAECMRGQDFHHLDALADEAQTAATEHGGRALIAVATECRAQADYHLGRYPAALLRFVDAIDRWREAGDRSAEARARLGHSSLLATCGLTHESLEEAQAALAQVDPSTSFELHLGALLAIARVHTTLRAWSEADTLYARALAAARGQGDGATTGRVLVDVGYFHCERSRAARAMDDRSGLARSAADSLASNDEAIALCRDAGQTKLEWVALLNRGEALMDLGQLDAARATTEDALARVRRAIPPSAHFEGEALFNLGQVALANGAYAEARTTLVEVVRIARQQGMNELLMKCCEALSTACEAEGDFRAALDFHKRFFAAHGEILSEAARLRASILAIQYETVEARAAVTAERERSRSLVAHNLSLQRESMEDALTALPNHRAFQRAFDRFSRDASSDAASPHPGFFLAMIDVDDFKAVNDRASHATGDAVLRTLGLILADACREGDFVARYGGEEFTLILPTGSRPNALSACERVRQAIEHHAWSLLAPDLRVTVSVGLAGSDEQGSDRMFEIADRRLYRAKRTGKNRVVATDD